MNSLPLSEKNSGQRPPPPGWLIEKEGPSISRGVRVNERIRIKEVRVINPDGVQLGILPIQEALEAAKSLALDLVEVAPDARPPVCRIMDYGKYRYEQSK